MSEVPLYAHLDPASRTLGVVFRGLMMYDRQHSRQDQLDGFQTSDLP